MKTKQNKANQFKSEGFEPFKTRNEEIFFAKSIWSNKGRNPSNIQIEEQSNESKNEHECGVCLIEDESQIKGDKYDESIPNYKNIMDGNVKKRNWTLLKYLVYIWNT